MILYINIHPHAHTTHNPLLDCSVKELHEATCITKNIRVNFHLHELHNEKLPSNLVFYNHLSSPKN